MLIWKYASKIGMLFQFSSRATPLFFVFANFQLQKHLYALYTPCTWMPTYNSLRLQNTVHRVVSPSHWGTGFVCDQVLTLWAVSFDHYSAYEIASDFSHFMDLFDELSQQVDNTEDNSTGLLDKDLKDSVLGKRLI